MLPHYFSQEISKFSTDRLCLSAFVTLDVCHFLRCVFTFFCIELRALNEYQLKKKTQQSLLVKQKYNMCIHFILCSTAFKDKVNLSILAVRSCKVWGCYLRCFFFLKFRFWTLVCKDLKPELCLKNFGFWINFQILYKFYSFI